MSNPDVTTLDPARWRWHALVLTVFVAVFLGRFAWPPLQSEAGADLGLTNAQAGLFMNAFYLGYLMTQLPGGMLADRFGAKLVLSVSLFISGIATLMIWSIDTAGTGYFWRVLAGLGGGAVYSAGMKATVAGFPRQELGRAFGILMIAPTLGTLIPNQLTPRLSLALGGWRPTFLALGVGLLLLWLFFLLVFPAKKSGRAPEAGGEPESPLAGLKYVLADRRLRLVCLIGFGLVWSFIGFVSWSNQYLIKEVGFTKLQAGHIMTGFGLVGLGSTVLSGFLSDRVRSTERLTMVFFAVELVGLATFPFLTSPVLLAVSAGLVGAGVGACSALLALLTSAYAGPRWAATAGGATGTIFQSSGLVSPFVLGLTVDWRGDYTLVWVILSLAVIIAIALLAVLTRIKTEANR